MRVHLVAAAGSNRQLSSCLLGFRGREARDIEVGYEVVRVFGTPHATVEYGPFSDFEHLIVNVAIHVGRWVQCDVVRFDRSDHMTVNFNGVGGDGAGNFASRADDNSLPVHVPADLAVNLEAVFGNHGDFLAQDHQVGADDGYLAGRGASGGACARCHCGCGRYARGDR
jgi:hypothetical protein